MPRVTSSSSMQAYSMTGYGNSTTASTSMNGVSSTSGVEKAPSSANSLPRFGGAHSVPAIPAPMSMKTSSSMFMNRSPNMVSPRFSPIGTHGVTTELPSIQSDSAPRQPNRNILRAAESGSVTLLPDFSTSSQTPSKAVMRNREPPNRSATRSSPSLKQIMGLGKQNYQGKGGTLPQTQQDLTPKTTMLQAAQQSLRRRTYSTTQSDDEEFDYSRKSNMSNDSPYRSRGRSGRRGAWISLQKLGRMKLGHILQVVIVVAVTALVWESHHKALFASQQLSQFKEEESLLLLHLQKIEQQSIQLHENLSRLAQSGVRVSAADGSEKKNGGDVDYDLIHKQTQQLYQMEEELNNEVRALQNRIQQSARNHIVTEFGEGPVQVILDLDFGAGDEAPHRINVLLWHDTPHAAWTWLEQIGRHVWDGAQFDWQQNHIIDAIPQKADPGGGKIEFVEQSQHGHEAWTIGLRESETGMMSMYVNLQDNTSLHKHETCVGKVIDGFDALQHLLEVARNQRDGAKSVITVRKASATHVTKKDF